MMPVSAPPISTIDRLTEVFFFVQMDVSMASLSKYTTAKDPDELLKQEGGQRDPRKIWIDNATGLIDYRIARLAGKTSGSGFAGIQRTQGRTRSPRRTRPQ